MSQSEICGKFNTNFAEAGKHWPTDSPQLCMWGRGRDSVVEGLQLLQGDLILHLIYGNYGGFQTVDQKSPGSGLVSVQLSSAKR
jgi:hypothetical protein